MKTLLVLACVLGMVLAGCDTAAPKNGDGGSSGGNTPAPDGSSQVKDGGKERGDSARPMPPEGDAGSEGDSGSLEGGALPPVRDAGTDAAASFDAGSSLDAGDLLDAALPSDAGDLRDAATSKSATITVGPNGGRFEVLGIVVDVPPFALTEAVELTLELTDVSPPDGYEAYSPVYRLTPPDVVLQKAILVTIPFSGDPTSAAGLVSKVGAIYDRVGGSVSSAGLTFRVEQPSWLFVGDGQDLPALFDRQCVRSRVLAGDYANNLFDLFSPRPAKIGLLASLEDCSGRPIQNLSGADFTITEDGIPLGVAPHVFPRSTMPQYVMIAIDISASTRVTRDQLIGAAKRFVHELLDIRKMDARIGVFAFDGRTHSYRSPVSRFPMPFSASSAKTLDDLDDLAKLSAGDPGSTNMHGAITDLVQDLAKARSNSRSWNQAGASAVGHAVLFLAGHTDTAGVVTRDETETALRDKRLGLTIVTPTAPDSILTDLRSLAANSLFVSQDVSNLPSEAAAAAALVHGRAASTYLLGYCSPTREASDRTARVVLNQANNEGSGGGFAFSGTFDSSCSFESFVSDCGGKECGGFYCGGCQEDLEYCSEATLTCLPGTAEPVPVGGGTPNCAGSACDYPNVCCGNAYTSSGGSTTYRYQCEPLGSCTGNDIPIECRTSSDCGQPGLCCRGTSGSTRCRRDACLYSETPTDPPVDQDGGVF